MDEQETQKNNTDAQTSPSRNPQAAEILKPLRTYERDIADLVRNHQTSAVDVVLAQRRKEETIRAIEKPKAPSPVQPLHTPAQPEKKVETESVFYKTQTATEKVVAEKNMYQDTREVPVFAAPPTPVAVSQPNPPGRDTGSMLYVEPQQEHTYRNKILLAMSVLLVVGGIAAFTGPFIIRLMNATVDEIVRVRTAIIPSDQTRELDIHTYVSAGQIAERFSAFAREEYERDSVTEIQIVRREAGTPVGVSPKTFFEIATPYIPSSLTRSFSDRMFVGLYSITETSPFFIIPISTFDTAFAGMLAWEQNMYPDIGPLVRTTTKNSSVLPGIPLQSFEDLVVQNKDTRVLKNNQGEIVILYSFVDEETLFITGNENTFKEILNRFSAAKLIR